MLRVLRRAVSPPPEAPVETLLPLPDGRSVTVRHRVHARAKRLRISISDEGVRLTVPPRVSKAVVLAFLQSHAEWIAEHLERFADDIAEPVRVFETTHLPLRGESLAVTWSRGKSDKVWREYATLHVQVRHTHEGSQPSAALLRSFRDFYRTEANADVARWMPALAAATGKTPVRIGLKTMRSQWGSMSSAGVMSLELSLVLGRPAAFHYVVVHELCHMLHHDHSPAYWQTVANILPEWKEERDYLHAHGRSLKNALRSILHAA